MPLEYLTHVRHILFELAPSLLLDFFIAGLLHVYLPPALIQRRLTWCASIPGDGQHEPLTGLVDAVRAMH
jgi:hypothetical protein